MWKNLIAMLIVSALSVGVCAFALTHLQAATGELDDVRIQVLELAESGEIDAAQAKLGQMAEAWSRREPMLEILAPHQPLHEITTLIIEGDANLSAGDADDFARSMALLGEAIRHLYEEEQLKLSNVL